MNFCVIVFHAFSTFVSFIAVIMHFFMRALFLFHFFTVIYFATLLDLSWSFFGNNSIILLEIGISMYMC
jgi:hypothetical protein